MGKASKEFLSVIPVKILKNFVYNSKRYPKASQIKYRCYFQNTQIEVLK
jgi:hypothetical protein